MKSSNYVVYNFVDVQVPRIFSELESRGYITPEDNREGSIMGTEHSQPLVVGRVTSGRYAGEAILVSMDKNLSRVLNRLDD